MSNVVKLVVSLSFLGRLFTDVKLKVLNINRLRVLVLLSLLKHEPGMTLSLREVDGLTIGADVPEGLGML